MKTVLVTALLLSGCIEREGRPLAPCTRVNVRVAFFAERIDQVDLLLMVDNSGSMSEEQASLAREFPILMNILASGDFEQDGSLDGPDDFEPVHSLNVGVITSDMGTGGFALPTCVNSDFGDDGVLRTQGNTAIAGCAASYPAILSFEPPGDAEAFARDVACVATVGTGGCGFEQQLEAILKAVTPTVAQSWTAVDFIPIGSVGAPNGLDRPFFRNSQPHGDGANAGFAREGAVLAIIPVTDEEDCSAWDENLFDPEGGPYSEVDLNLRCTTFPDALHPIERYVAGFTQLRRRPGLVVFSPIVGVPLDLVPERGEFADLDAILADPRMTYRADPFNENRLLPSCSEPGRGVAFPPRRIVQVARDLNVAGAQVTVQSICKESFAGALREITRQISRVLGSVCLPRPLNTEADGSVGCDVVALLPPGITCDAYGAEPKRDVDGPVFEGGRAVCVLNQIVPVPPAVPTGDHWYYDTYTDQGRLSCGNTGLGAPFQRIAFTRQPPFGTEVHLECFAPVQDGTSIGTFCDPSIAVSCAGLTSETGVPLVCDPAARTCGVRCATDADCRTAGLVGFVCDSRPLEEVDPAELAGNTSPRELCVNPTCE